MPYTTPTATQLKARFPAFSGVADPVVTAAISEAANRVDQSWDETDYQLAIMLYAAHVMTTDGLGASDDTLFAGLRSVTIGPLSFSSVPLDQQSSASGGLKATSFGRRFLELLRRNHPPILAVT